MRGCLRWKVEKVLDSNTSAMSLLPQFTPKLSMELRDHPKRMKGCLHPSRATLLCVTFYLPKEAQVET